MEAYRIFTVSAGKVEEGAKVELLTLSNNISIPIIGVGEEGRGRKKGIVSLDVSPGTELIRFAEVGETRKGAPKLLSKESASTDEAIIVVLATPIGFRGGNYHTGDRTDEWWTLVPYEEEFAKKADISLQDCYNEEEVKRFNPMIMKAEYDDDEKKWRWDAAFRHHRSYAEFPGKQIADGQIAQGKAGRMGSGQQMIAIIPKNVVFRTAYSGRLYGEPGAHYYKWDGQQLLALTWEERVTSDLF